MKKIISVLTSLALLCIGWVTFSSPASAHTGDLTATYVCQDDGTYLATYSLTLSKSDLSSQTWWRIGTSAFQGTPSSNAGMDKGPIARNGAGTFVLGTQVLPGSTTSPPWVYAFTRWSDYFTKGSDGRKDSLPGTCKPAKPEKPSPVVKPLTEPKTDCSGVWSRSGTETTDWAWNDSSWKWIATSPVTVWDEWVKVRDLTNAEKAELDCVKPPMPEKEPQFTTWEDGKWVCGDTTVAQTRTKTVFTYTFNKETWSWDEHSSTSTETNSRDLTSDELKECFTVEIPAKPAVTDECGPDNVKWSTLTDTEQIAWSKNEDGSITATVIAEGLSFTDGKKTHTYDLPEDTNVPCDVELTVPAEPTVIDKCDTAPSWEFPTTEHVTWSVAKESGSAVATADEGFYFLVNGEKVSQVVFNLPEDTNVACPTETPTPTPTETPTSTVTPSPSPSQGIGTPTSTTAPEPSQTNSATPTATSTPVAKNSKPLPNTGASAGTILLIIAGTMLLILGIAFLVLNIAASRKRKH